MECQNCANCEDPLTDDWLKKFPDITYCALCVEELGEPNDTDIDQECSRCDTPLGYHHQKQCPVCSECHDWCGHMIAFTPNFLFEGPQLCRWKNSKPIDRFIEAHEDYGKAYWEARERLGDDAQFLPLWNDLQDKHNATLKAIYGESWKFEDHDLWASGLYDWDTLLALLGELTVFLVDTEGGGAAGACWESQNVYVEDPKAAMKIANQNANDWASNLRDIIKQIASL